MAERPHIPSTHTIEASAEAGGRAGASDFWSRAVERAESIARAGEPAADLLIFYAELLRAQQTVQAELNRNGPSGSIEADAEMLAGAAAPLIRYVRDRGPTQLAAEAEMLRSANDGALADAIVAYWCDRSHRRFFAKAIVQPYARWRGSAAIEATLPHRLDNRCPQCGGTPQLSILDAGAMAGDGGGRRLLCATCLSAWPFRRIVCPACGEENEHRLGYFISPTVEHLRVDVCDACRRYLKSIDLGRLGHAFPLVDEVAGVALDLWAIDQGYVKIELNLLGL